MLVLSVLERYIWCKFNNLFLLFKEINISSFFVNVPFHIRMTIDHMSRYIVPTKSIKSKKIILFSNPYVVPSVRRALINHRTMTHCRAIHRYLRPSLRHASKTKNTEAISATELIPQEKFDLLSG